jgi:hypothetical protein
MSSRRLASFLYLAASAVGMLLASSKTMAEELADFIAKQSAVFAKDGADFDPFLIKSTVDLEPYWIAEGDTKTRCAFCIVKGKGDFLPLGDVIITGFKGATPDVKAVGSLLFAPKPGKEDALKHPLRFEYLMDGVGAGGGRDLNYFQPVPPDGYEAMGICFNRSNTFPDVNKYWCVKKQYLVRISRSKEPCWSDEGSHMDNNMNLHAPELATNQPKPSSTTMLLVPNTVTPGELDYPMWALRLKQLYVTMPDRPAEEIPVAKALVRENDVTARSLKPIAVIPFTALPHQIGQPALDSPFYFIVCETYWQCRSTRNFPVETTVNVSVGVTETASEEIAKKTSLTVSAEVGVEYGGVTSQISSSFSSEFGINKSKSVEKSTLNTRELKYTTPADRVNAIWQHVKSIAIYSGDFDEVSRIEYGTDDTDLKSFEIK